MGAFTCAEGFFLYVECRHRKIWQAVAKLFARHRKDSKARLSNLECFGAESAFHHKRQRRQPQTAWIALLGLPSSTRDHKAFDRENASSIVELTVTDSGAEGWHWSKVSQGEIK